MKRAGVTNNFVATIPLDRSKNHIYKFVVDGEWKHSDDLPTEQDHSKFKTPFTHQGSLYSLTFSSNLNPYIYYYYYY